MHKNLVTSVLYTVVTALLLGIAYPVFMAALAHMLFPYKADGQLLTKNGEVIGSRIIGQSFTGPGYFHSRPSAAGTGYDATSSGGSNYAATNAKYIARVEANVLNLQKNDPGIAVPVDLVTTSGSGLDPDITPAAAEFQVPRVAKECGLSIPVVEDMVRKHTESRQFGFLGEPRVNVLELNLALLAVCPQEADQSLP
ncbi:MAG: potassium-transporting ATPase subunit KdpC [Acidobacteria bacterium]|nr:potassium-transporting ATPase subunit KdpC [Acidobacteriota bacterium]